MRILYAYYEQQLVGRLSQDEDLVFHFEYDPLFVIERYDRSQGHDGLTHRIHQQDFCQAQGFTREQKYEDKGGPTLKQGYELILKHFPAKKRLRSLINLLDWVAFNLLIGNNDSHSKNISFYYRLNDMIIYCQNPRCESIGKTQFILEKQTHKLLRTEKWS